MVESRARSMLEQAEKVESCWVSLLFLSFYLLRDVFSLNAA